MQTDILNNVRGNFLGMFILGCVLLFTHCESENGSRKSYSGAESQDQPEKRNDMPMNLQKGDEDLEVVALNAEKLKQVDITYDTLRTMNLSESIKTNGHMHLAPNYRSMISTLIGGRVNKINVIEGDYVRKGETLALLEGMAITQLQQEYLSNKAEIPYLKKEYERKKRLMDERVGAASELEKAKAEYESLLAELNAQEQNLKMLGIFEVVRESEISPTVSITAPFNGHIGDVHITRGEYKEPHQSLIEVLNTNKAHLELQVYEKNIGKVMVGQSVLFKYANQPGNWIKGEIFRVGKKYHKETQSIRVHAHIHNPEEISITPGIYVTARIKVKTGESYALPQEGIVRDGNKTYVFAPAEAFGKETQQGFKQFVRIPVETGPTEEGFTSIRAFKHDVPTDIRFVSRGASTLESELKKGAGGGHHH